MSNSSVAVRTKAAKPAPPRLSRAAVELLAADVAHLRDQIVALRLALEATVGREEAHEHFSPELAACLALAETVEDLVWSVSEDFPWPAQLDGAA